MDEIPEPDTRQFNVAFHDGPMDGKLGTLPFLPQFMVLHEMGGIWFNEEKPLEFEIDGTLHRHVYMLTDRRSDDEPYVYVFRRKGEINLEDYLKAPPREG